MRANEEAGVSEEGRGKKRKHRAREWVRGKTGRQGAGEKEAGAREGVGIRRNLVHVGKKGRGRGKKKG